MQKCSACQKAIATVHILELEDGAIVENKHLCESCAESGPLAQNKLSMISQMIGSAPKGSAAGAICPGCRLTAAEFRMRGRLGCPRCYEVFRSSLLPLLERVHDAVTHRGRFPGRTANPADVPVSLTDLRNRLDDAIAAERYEEAAELRDQLQRMSGEEGSS